MSEIAINPVLLHNCK